MARRKKSTERPLSKKEGMFRPTHRRLDFALLGFGGFSKNYKMILTPIRDPPHVVVFNSMLIYESHGEKKHNSKKSPNKNKNRKSDDSLQPLPIPKIPFHFVLEFVPGLDIP